MNGVNGHSNGPASRGAIPPKSIQRPGREVKVAQPVVGCNSVWFTRHALDRMKQRRVVEAEVFHVLNNPTRKGLPTQPKRERWRRNRNKKVAIDALFERRRDRLLLVTAIKIEI